MPKALKQIRILTIFFIVALIISGVTAFPLYSEMRFLANSSIFAEGSAMQHWMTKVWNGMKYMHDQYPFMFYGYDWLAFAHLVIAILFIGVYQHPVRNRWITQWAIITCISVIPLAVIAGLLRGIPVFHILIDCSFGLFGLIPLRIIQVKIGQLQKIRKRSSSSGDQ